MPLKSLRILSSLLFLLFVGCGGPPKRVSYKYKGVSKAALIQALNSSINQLRYTTIIFKEERGMIIIQDTDKSAPAQAVVTITPSDSNTVVTLEAISMDSTGEVSPNFDRFARLFEETNQNVGVQPERTEVH